MTSPDRADLGSQPSRILQVATAPARWLSRWRPDLGVSLSEDGATFAAAAARVFAVLAVIAVAYPIVASVVHAAGISAAVSQPEQIMTRALFIDAYSESLIFMTVAAGLGAFSPALGVLFLAVFIPADLVAASIGSELIPPAVWDPWPVPIAARAISYGLLWFLAVEIPLRVRRWATSRTGPGQPSSVASVATTMVGTAVLAFFWAAALPWLITPVGSWTNAGRSQPWVTDPIWLYWPVLVIGATLIAGVAALWPRPTRLRAVASAASTGAAPTTAKVLVRQTVAVLVLAVLLASLMTSLQAAVILIGGLFVAGPVLTLLLPRLRLPPIPPRAGSPARFVIAMVIAVAAGWLIWVMGAEPTSDGYALTAITLALVAPLFRILFEAGPPRPASADTRAPQSGPPATVITASIGLLAGVAWLALPELVLANDCFTAGEVVECVLTTPTILFGLVGAALLGAALWGAMSRPSNPPKPEKRAGSHGFPRHFDSRRDFDEWAEEVEYDGPPPPYLTPGGPPDVNLPSTPRGF